MDDRKLYGSSDNGIDSLVNSVKNISGDIRMKFGMDKCTVLKIKRGKQVQCEGIDFRKRYDDRGS